MDRFHKKAAKQLFVLAINIGLSVLLFLATSADYEFVDYINILFYIAIIYFMFWLILLIVKGGFFDGIVYGFRNFHDKTSENVDYVEATKPKRDLSNIINHSFYGYVRSQSLILVAIFLLLLVIYYI